MGFGKTEVDVGTQGLKRHAAVTIPFGTGDFGTGETAGAGNLDAFGAVRFMARRKATRRSSCMAMFSATS